ncbi:LacI family DNA-binding transcriptional regulator [Luoshenia tenuis]|jgi:LacI family transcriptional regulator|uniref:LacI family DNA-binding transcriptional regulator n=1 Tax=Luoshenia tenuis TaxID=2763654 RepID=UPI003D8B0DB0
MTINDIARLAGTSKSTVSRVLNHDPHVSDETRRRVMDAVRRNHYQPNSIARGLVQGATRLVALIISDIRNPYYSEVTWYIEKELEQQGYHMFLGCSGEDPEKERNFVDLAAQYNFAGAIVISPTNEAYLLQSAPALGCPVILLNRYIDDFAGDMLTTDNFHGGSLAAHHLLVLGHRRVAVFSGDKNTTTHRDRRAGFVHALSLGGVALPEAFSFTTRSLDMDSGHTLGSHLLSLGSAAPTAIFCTTDLMAIGLLQAYRNAGKSIPENLSIIGFDDIPYAGLAGIGLTTIAQPYEQIGKLAVQMLLERINSPARPQRREILDCQLISRASTGPCG